MVTRLGRVRVDGLGAPKRRQLVNVLMLHNRYLIRGGEDESTDAEAVLLREHGHEVDLFEMDNTGIAGGSLLQTGIDTVWSRGAYRAVRQKLQEKDYDLAHIQNFFPLFSPSVHYAIKDECKPIVQSLRNYRLLCLNGLLFRAGGTCQDCVGKAVAWPGVLHGCYRESRAGSLVVASMLATHRILRTWSRKVDVFLTSSEFARGIFIEGGLCADKIAVKPNFVHPDPGPGAGQREYIVLVSRLTEEKGIQTVLEAWQRLVVSIPLKIVGDGPLAEVVNEATRRMPWIENLGRRKLNEVYDLMGRARLALFPTELYETFGRVIIEAFAKGTPVLTSSMGSGSRLVHEGRTGLHYSARDPSDLAAKVRWAWEHPGECLEMGRAARGEYEAKYTADGNYPLLIDAYEAAILRNRMSSPR